jgi:hypothetical protein
VLVGCCLAEVSERLALFGRNELVSKRTPKWKILVSKFQGPMPYMVSGARPIRVIVCVCEGGGVESARGLSQRRDKTASKK